MTNNNSEFEVVVSEGKRAWYEVFLATVFLSIFFYLLLSCIYYITFDVSLGPFVENLFLSCSIGLYSLAQALKFAVVKNILIDVDSDRLISRYLLGPFSHDVVKITPEFEYVSVFKNDKEYFETNLWYKGNKHYKMYAFEEKQPAMDFADDVARKLNIDLLDATEKGNSKWIEKN
ncbi:hypothetical protein ABGT15_14445 [Flavobacterium enshiense]|uniref:hypothetical protein n=1 Tax=Flavobacterium enshiense TaxID=1341165 RepID=UPI00345CB796